MRRRQLITALPLAALAIPSAAELVGPVILPRLDISPVEFRAGDFLGQARLEISDGWLTYCHIDLMPAPDRAHYNTTALERLRAAGLVPPNDIEKSLTAVEIVRDQAIFKGIRLNEFTFWSEWRFAINTVMPLGDEINVAETPVNAKAVLSVIMAPGVAGRVVIV